MSSDEKGFLLLIDTEENSLMASICENYENCLLYHNNGSYYEVVNGPIDIEWIEHQKEKYE